MSDEEILVAYFGGRPQWSGNKLYKIGDMRVEYSGTKLYKVGGAGSNTQGTNFIRLMENVLNGLVIKFIGLVIEECYRQSKGSIV